MVVRFFLCLFCLFDIGGVVDHYCLHFLLISEKRVFFFFSSHWYFVLPHNDDIRNNIATPAPVVLVSDTQRRRCSQNFKGIVKAVKLVSL